MTVIGVVVTIALGLGITQLSFATGQDSYLNKSDQVYKDNVVYQRLFGGQAMLTVISMKAGHTVDELFTGDGRRAVQGVPRHADANRQGPAVVTPLTILEFSDALVSSPDGNPTTSVAGKALLAAQAKEVPGSPAAAARARPTR